MFVSTITDLIREEDRLVATISFVDDGDQETIVRTYKFKHPHDLDIVLNATVASETQRIQDVKEYFTDFEVMKCKNFDDYVYFKKYGGQKGSNVLVRDEPQKSVISPPVIHVTRLFE